MLISELLLFFVQALVQDLKHVLGGEGDGGAGAVDGRGAVVLQELVILGSVL